MSLMVSETPLIMAGKVQQSRAVLKSQRPGSRRDQHSQGITAGQSPGAHHTRTRISQVLLRSNQVTIKIN